MNIIGLNQTTFFVALCNYYFNFIVFQFASQTLLKDKKYERNIAEYIQFYKNYFLQVIQKNI